MTQNKVTELNAWFDQQIELCNTQNKKLAADGYKDEAVFEKIKANVYDIFRTILSVAVKTNSTNPDNAKRFFETKLEQIPSGWHARADEGAVQILSIQTGTGDLLPKCAVSAFWSIARRSHFPKHPSVLHNQKYLVFQQAYISKLPPAAEDPCSAKSDLCDL